MDVTLVNYMQDSSGWFPQTSSDTCTTSFRGEARLVGLMGSRGVGKSAMVLQRLKAQDEGTRSKSLYVSADYNYFLTHTLEETAA